MEIESVVVTTTFREPSGKAGWNAEHGTSAEYNTSPTDRTKYIDKKPIATPQQLEVGTFHWSHVNLIDSSSHAHIGPEATPHRPVGRHVRPNVGVA